MASLAGTSASRTHKLLTASGDNMQLLVCVWRFEHEAVLACRSAVIARLMELLPENKMHYTRHILPSSLTLQS